MNQAEDEGHDPAFREQPRQQIGGGAERDGEGDGGLHQPGGQGNDAQRGQRQRQRMGDSKGGDDGQGLGQGATHGGCRLPAAPLPHQHGGKQQGEQEQDVVVADQDVVDALMHKPLKGLPLPCTTGIEIVATLVVAERHRQFDAVVVRPEQAVVAGVPVEQEAVMNAQL